MTIRTRARVAGTVQGVGFRPFVYRIAHEQDLGGWVLNDEHGVLLEVEGNPDSVARFFVRMRSEAPPLASVDDLSCEPVRVLGETRFAIRASQRTGAPDALVVADSATCDECLAEMTDPDDRRYRYPFINCTNCGPRFTIVRDVPYDRPLTTMAGFAMCAACRGEYEDPGNRRFHAQPNACPVCGPRVRLLDTGGAEIRGADDPVRTTAARLAEGEIVAVKGLGGYHLVCDAASEDAVAALRARKHREDKPFAVMVAGTDDAATLIELSAATRALLEQAARPIVLAARNPLAPVAPAVAPGAPELGVMLPYTPLHHLLLADAGGRPLVMTSGNVSDEPIAYRDDDARARLAGIADLFLVHDRPIETRTDDSVLRVSGGRSQMLRRSRGYVPARLVLPVPTRQPLLACGAEQKNTFCVAKGARAWVSHHIGDLEHVSTLRAYTEGIAHFERLFAVTPEVVVHDRHPGYLSTQYALERDGVTLVDVQHHHAHLAACLAEHGLSETTAVGAIFDGTGYGDDGTVWGGELLVGGLTGVERVAWLRPVAMPGGAAAIRQPWRMAWSWLAEAFGEPQPLPPSMKRAIDPARWQAMGSVAASPAVSPLTSSMGRLFDAVGALCGLRQEVTYEGQAAIELEAAASRAARGSGRYEIALTDPRPGIRALVGDLRTGTDVTVVAARFHRAIAAATVDCLVAIAAERNLETAVLSGGVFQNRLLLETTAAGACAAGLRVVVCEKLPPNDGGIAFGQAAIAAARLTVPIETPAASIPERRQAVRH
jgi:hydrogenase maturation protein HypF